MKSFFASMTASGKQKYKKYLAMTSGIWHGLNSIRHLPWAKFAWHVSHTDRPSYREMALVLELTFRLELLWFRVLENLPDSPY